MIRCTKKELYGAKKADMLYSSGYLTHMVRDIQKLPEDVTEGKRQAFKVFQEEGFNQKAVIVQAKQSCCLLAQQIGLQEIE